MKVAIAGAGAVGRSIARELVDNSYEVSLIERNPGHFDVDEIPAADWIFGDACELSLLEAMHLEEFDVVIAATGDDKANVVLSLLAKTEFAVPRVVARVNDPRNEWLFDSAWGVDVAVSTPRMLASLVEEAFAVGDVVRLMEFRKGNANLVEITLPEDTPWGGRPVRKLNLPRDVALVTILRGQRVIFPEPDQPLEGGDELLFVAAPDVEAELRSVLAGASSSAAGRLGSRCGGRAVGVHRPLGGPDGQVGHQRADGGQRPAHRDARDPEPAGLVRVVEVVLNDEAGGEDRHPGQGRRVEGQHRAAGAAPTAVVAVDPTPHVADHGPADEHRDPNTAAHNSDVQMPSRK